MRYFGTDGIRGKAQALIDNKTALLLGRAIAKRGGKVLVARDVRPSSFALEKQLCLGLAEGNCQIWLTGVLPTPALSYIAFRERADFAVMITASHNPPEFNGLKVFGKYGKKLSSSDEVMLDRLLDGEDAPPMLSSIQEESAASLEEEEMGSELKLKALKRSHSVRIASGAQQLYRQHILDMFGNLDGTKLRIDAAHGCFAELAAGIFEELGAEVVCVNDSRDGNLVNVECGSTHIAEFAKTVLPDEIGFAFDGDGDRVLAVVNNEVYDGDAILLAIASLYRIKGKLKKKLVVGTELSGAGLQRELALQNIALIRADVGDKHVLDALEAMGCPLGGEKSGHIIMLDRANTGDGLITALTLLEVKKELGALPSYTPYPSLELNIPAESPAALLASDGFRELVAKAEQIVGKSGRLTIRPSGTEPFVRITCECFSDHPALLFSTLRTLFPTK